MKWIYTRHHGKHKLLMLCLVLNRIFNLIGLNHLVHHWWTNQEIIIRQIKPRMLRGFFFFFLWLLNLIVHRFSVWATDLSTSDNVKSKYLRDKCTWGSEDMLRVKTWTRKLILRPICQEGHSESEDFCEGQMPNVTKLAEVKLNSWICPVIWIRSKF